MHRAEQAEAALKAMTEERDGLLTQIRYERNEIKVRQGLREAAESALASSRQRAERYQEIVEAGREVYFEAGVHPAKWIESGAGYEERTPEMDAWNAKVMRLFKAYAALADDKPQERA